jgi:metal-dependent amidase/aminoacylase/carboxypeptidase family protein
MPLRNDPALKNLFEKNAKTLFGESEFCEVGHRTGSTDMGDVSYIMPSLHPYMSGASGPGHSAEWHIADKEMGYMGPAKSLALMAVDLLCDNAKEARSILSDYKPAMSKTEYLDFQANLFQTEMYDGMDEPSKRK